jgi:CelD/BcsL family acetyltransferase involved in cellulose biosynthesis
LLESESGNEMRWRVYPIREFQGLRSQWDALNAASGNLPFLQSEFIVPALREFAIGDELIATYGSDQQLSAIGLVRQRRAGMWETFQPSQLPLGAFLMGRGTAIDEILGSLLRELPGVAVAVALTQQDPGIVDRPDDSAVLETIDYIDTARVRIAGTFDDYWAARGKNLRHNVKRQRAKLAEQGLSLRLEVVASADDVAAAIADYGRLESSGWKAQEGTAVGLQNKQGRFYRSVFESFCAQGSGRIYRYLFGDRVVAMDLCLERAGALIVLKTTYDETVKVVSPATLMRHEVFRALFDEGRLERVEFFGKAMEWHLRWTGDLRTLYHVNLYRWPALKRLRRALGQVKKSSAAGDGVAGEGAANP